MPVLLPARPAVRRTAALSLAGAVALAACGGRGDGGGTAGAPDSALARDLTLANGGVRAPAPDPAALGGDTAAARPTPPPVPFPEVAPAATPAAAPAVAPARAEPARPAAPRPAPRPAPARRAESPAPAAAGADDAPAAEPTAAEGSSARGDGAGAGAGRSLAAGTVLAGTLAQRVCTESSRPGDRLVATLGGAASGPAGVVLPAGTPLVLEVARVAGDPPTAEFVVRGVSVDGDFVPVVADASPVTGATERREVVDKAGSSGSGAVKGAIAGAILGRVLGGRGARGTIIGAAGGAAAGAAMGRGRSHEETCVAGGARVEVRLTERLTLR